MPRVMPTPTAEPARTEAVPPASMSAPIPRIEAFLSSFLDSLGLPGNLDAAARYSLFGPGKRARPVLVVHCHAAATGAQAETERCLPAAAAVEMIHAFSLVHDDLPALDNDRLRRGRATTHVEHGHAMAILAGDLLNTLAFQVIAERCDDPGLSGALAFELARGTTAMIAGQVLDSLGGLPAGLSERERLELIHRNKTGALIRASCRMGGLCALWNSGGVSDPTSLDALSRYGEAIGLMFQVVDDLLDVEQTVEHTGKATGKDAALGKLTYPSVIGIEASRHEVSRLRELSLDALRPFGSSASPLRELAEYLAVRTR